MQVQSKIAGPLMSTVTLTIVRKGLGPIGQHVRSQAFDTAVIREIPLPQLKDAKRAARPNTEAKANGARVEAADGGADAQVMLKQWIHDVKTSPRYNPKP